MDLTGCPRLSGLQLLSRKWSYLVLRSLRAAQVFSDLKREFTIITNRTLSQELQHLVAEGLVVHSNGVYSLSEKGAALLAAAEPLHRWAVQYHSKQFCPPELSCGHCANYQELVQLKRTH